MNTDTPETDAAICRHTVTYGMIGKYVEADFARQLERERDEAREQRTKAVEKYQAVVKEMHKAGMQRDRLAEAVNAATVLIAAKGRHNTMLAYEGLRSALSPENADVDARRAKTPNQLDG